MTEAVTATKNTTSPKGDKVILDVKGLKKFFPIQKGLLRKTVGYVKAVDDVSFFVREGETAETRPRDERSFACTNRRAGMSFLARRSWAKMANRGW
jgi:hypothetical protein